MSVGDKKTLTSLEHLRDMITARRADLTARGIELVQWGGDIPNNRTLLEVKSLTPATKGALERGLGPAQVEVTNSAGWSLASRTADWAPSYGGDTLHLATIIALTFLIMGLTAGTVWGRAKNEARQLDPVLGR